MGFMERWMSNHWDDARTVLKKPLVIAEFGKSSKDPGFTSNERDLYMGNVYRDIYRFARTGGTMSGSLVWQLMAEGMDSYYDGYEIVLSKSPSTAGIMSRQSHAMNALSHLFSTHDNAHVHGDGAMMDAHRHVHRATSNRGRPFGRRHPHHHHQRKSAPHA